MLSVILIWIYMVLITGAMGLVLSVPSRRFLEYNSESIIPIILMGLTGVTVYSEIFSLFLGVGLAANLILIVSLFVLILIFRKEIKTSLHGILQNLISKKYLAIIGGFVFVIMAYGASHGYMHYDTALYHAQSIHWIEELGIVPGLGNLHTRLGYNSAAFPMTALFSFAWMGGQSYHVCSGFCALLLGWECLGIYKNIIQKRITLSLFSRVMAIYYLFMIYDEMVSPASDYYMVCLAFILVIRWITYAEEETPSEGVYAMLAIFACFILTIKLSGAMLILCAVFPGTVYIKKHDWKSFLECIGTGIVIITPYLIRNVIISGWLLYPSTAFNWFNVDWKIPIGTAEYDYREIQVYGRGFTDVSRYSEPITKWFGEWFKSQSALDRLFILAAIVGVALFVVKCLYYGFSLCKHQKPRYIDEIWVMEAVVGICFLFWLFTSPLFRYGCLFVYLTDALIWGRFICEVSEKKVFRIFVLAGLFVLMLYKTGMFFIENVRGYRGDCLIAQQDYDEYEVTTYDIDGQTIYKPVEGDQTGYKCFPSSPWEMDIELRGNTINFGFRAK